MRPWFGIVLPLAAGPPAGARAQSFDSTRARSPSERAICTQPSLGALDRAVAGAYAAALAHPGADAASVRAGQRSWLRGRDAGCTPPARRSASAAAPAAPPATPAAAPALAAPSPPPAIPMDALPQAEAALDQAALPATAPGSATGAALQVADMMSGLQRAVRVVAQAVEQAGAHLADLLHRFALLARSISTPRLMMEIHMQAAKGGQAAKSGHADA